MIAEFEGEVFRWEARSEAWFFAAVPEALSADIREIPRMPRGFGAVRVFARIGGSSWRTSIFPSGETGGYILPLKRSIREAEDVRDGATVHVHLEVLDV